MLNQFQYIMFLIHSQYMIYRVKELAMVFISYETTTGLQFAKHLKRALSKHNKSSFVAEQDIKYGEDPTQTIDYNLKECRFLVLILTITAFTSSEVRKEFLNARETGKHIIPCIKDGLEHLIKEEFEELQNFQYSRFETKEDLANNVLEMILKEEMEQIKTSLRRLKKRTRRDRIDDLLGELVNNKSEIFFWLTEPDVDPNEGYIFRTRLDVFEKEKIHELEKIKKDIVKRGIPIAS